MMDTGKWAVLVFSMLHYFSVILQAGSNPDLTSSISDGSRVYIDQPITITCIARGTQILAWQSDEYIGLGGQLDFGPGDAVGRRVISEVMDQTFAVLTRRGDEPPVVLESQLRLTVASKYPNFTITCRNVDQDLANSVTYTISGNNATQLILSEGNLCPEDDLRLACIGRNTSALVLSSDYNNLILYCQKNDPPTRNTTIAGIGAAVETNYSDTTSVLICRLEFKSGQLLINQLTMSCLNVDIGVTATASFEVTDKCSLSHTTTESVNVTNIILTTIDPITSASKSATYIKITISGILLSLLSQGAMRLLCSY